MKNWKRNIGYLRSWIIYEANPIKRIRLSRFYRPIINSGDLCFDIGAHTGIQSAVWEKLGALVVAVEPNPLFYKKLVRRFKNRPSIHVLDLAISDQEEETTMFLSSIAPTVSTLADDEWQEEIKNRSSFSFEWDQPMKVQTTTIDQLIEKYGVPHLIKLDIESFESRALRGLHHPINWISFEYFSYLPTDSLQCIKEITRLGNYMFNYSTGEKFWWTLDTWLTPTEIITWIKNRHPDAPHGDIYARLKK